MSVYAVPQVIAAAFPISQISGEVATLVKLTRVLLLGPVVVLIGAYSYFDDPRQHGIIIWRQVRHG